MQGPLGKIQKSPGKIQIPLGKIQGSSGKIQKQPGKMQGPLSEGLFLIKKSTEKIEKVVKSGAVKVKDAVSEYGQKRAKEEAKYPWRHKD